jgi:hypothetical protein
LLSLYPPSISLFFKHSTVFLELDLTRNIGRHLGQVKSEVRTKTLNNFLPIPTIRNKEGKVEETRKREDEGYAGRGIGEASVSKGFRRPRRYPKLLREAS